MVDDGEFDSPVNVRRRVAEEFDIRPEVCEFSDQFNHLSCDAYILHLGLLPGHVQTHVAGFHIETLQSGQSLVSAFCQQKCVLCVD